MFYLIFIILFVIRRVHISEKTLSFLHGEFEVEPAFGEKREEALRNAGLKTFFITKVLKPVRTQLSLMNSLVLVSKMSSNSRRLQITFSSEKFFSSSFSPHTWKWKAMKIVCSLMFVYVWLSNPFPRSQQFAFDLFPLNPFSVNFLNDGTKEFHKQRVRVESWSFNLNNHNIR